jgi:glycosyltransferase involved in cell wall biosynthesis
MNDERPALVEDGKLLVLSYYFPPMSVGPAFVMDALMRRFDPRGVVVVMGDPDRYSDHREEIPRDVDVRVHDIPAWWPRDDRELGVGPVRIPLRLRALGNVGVSLKVAAESIRMVRRDDVRALLAIYPKQHFLLAACVASAFSRKPLAVYFMDTYVEGLPRGRKVARTIERYLARRAGLVFAMSEAHRTELQGRWAGYGAEDVPIVELPHPYDAEEDVPATELAGSPAILFTGAIYDAQADSIRRLIRALDEIEGAELHLLTQSSVDELAALRIHESDRVHIRAASRAEARSAQRGADILFLPIAFDAKPHVIATASPSKMPEYLATGRPILVHAPADSYLTRYAREQRFAEIVDERDAAALAAAVRRLCTHDARRAELAEAAAQTLERHRADAVAQTFSAELRRAVRRWKRTEAAVEAAGA